MSYFLDDDAFPLVLVTWTGTVTAESIRSLIEESNRIAARAEKAGVSTVTIHDSRKQGRPSPETRVLMADLTKATAVSHSLGEVVVLDSAALRGVLTAISWVAPGAIRKVKTVASLDDAYAKAAELFKAAGQAVPAPPAWVAQRPA